MYGTGIFFYLLALLLAAPFNSKARAMLAGRWKWRKKLKAALPEKQSRRIWFHCASLGEFEMARPILETLKKQHPDAGIVVSFFSPSGYLQRKDYPCEGVFYLPLDFARNARDWYRIVQPDVAVFVKYEFWLRYMQEGLKAGVTMTAAGCLFREGQFIFEPWASAWKRCLQDFSRIFVQNESSADIGRQHGLRNLQVNGDTRFDRVLEVLEQAPVLPEIEHFKGDSVFCIGGSTWAPEEKLLQQFIQNNGMPVKRKFMLVPHDVGEKHIQEICGRFGEYGCIRYSELINGADAEKARFLVVDRIGLLAGLYRYGDAAIIGGAWGKGLHNMLEAAAWGMPILFGPKHQKFPEAAESMEAGFGFECTDFDSFEKHLKMALGNPESRAEAAEKARNFVRRKAGATAAVVEYLGHGRDAL